MPNTEAELAGCAGQPLETERLILRPPTAADAPDIVRFAGDWEVARFTARIPHPYGAADAEAWLAGIDAARAEGRELVFAIQGREDRAFMGAIGLNIVRDENEAAAGFWLGRPYWGRGYVTEALERLLRFAFEELGLAQVRAAARPENPASIRVQEKAGMALLGETMEPAPARGGEFPVEVRAISRGDWLARHALPTVLVAAVALLDTDGRVLLSRRPEGKTMAGLWEFPGGKVAPGETPEAALMRELKEELGLDTRQSCLAPFTFASHRYARFHLLMPLFVCRVWEGTAKGREGQALAWVRPARLGDYQMPPADAPLAAMLRDFL